MSRAVLIIAVITMAVVAGAAFLLLSPKAPEPAPEVIMTGAQFAQECNQYKVNPPSGATSGYYDYPSLAPGDIVRVRDTVTAIEYSNTTRATRVVLSGFEGAPALKDGLLFAKNLTKKYKVGDRVELAFHVIQANVIRDNIPTAVELLDELNGKARERSPDGIPAASIRKYG